MIDRSGPRSHAALLVLGGGVVAGTFDIVYACTFWAIKASLPPSRVFQSVAAGLVGPASFQGGVRTATLGLALHFFIALSMSIAYYLVARRWSLLVRRPVLCGVVYGVVLYAVMNFIVIPLSAAPHGTKFSRWVVLSVAVHMFLIGLPIALFGGRAAAGMGVNVLDRSAPIPAQRF